MHGLDLGFLLPVVYEGPAAGGGITPDSFLCTNGWSPAGMTCACSGAAPPLSECKSSGWIVQANSCNPSGVTPLG